MTEKPSAIRTFEREERKCRRKKGQVLITNLLKCTNFKWKDVCLLTSLRSNNNSVYFSQLCLLMVAIEVGVKAEPNWDVYTLWKMLQH